MNHDAVYIRQGVSADAAALAEFGRRLYDVTFRAYNDPQNMDAYLAANYGIRQQTGELNSQDVITLLAETGDKFVGFAQVRHHPPPDCVTSPDPVELWRFYIDIPYHGRGVAQLLMQAVHEAARELGGRMVWLSVWERNARAIAFYTKMGFKDMGTTDFWVGEDRQTDRVMAVEYPGSE